MLALSSILLEIDAKPPKQMENQIPNQKNLSSQAENSTVHGLPTGSRSMMPPAFQLATDGEEGDSMEQSSLSAPSPVSIRSELEPATPKITSEWLGDREVEGEIESDDMESNSQHAETVQNPDANAVQMASDSPPKGLKVTHATKFVAPNGGSSSRKKVGVGEEVVFKSSKRGNWTVSSGTITSGAANSKKMTWTAPAAAGNTTIKITSGTETQTIDMSVVAPGNVTADKLREKAFTAGDAGAGMYLRLKYNSMDVSFGNIQVKEVSGPATNITGYFTRFSALDLRHNSGDSFFGLGSDNKDLATDEASMGPIKAPFVAGTFDWIIPYHYRIGTDSSTESKFTDVTQAFAIQADGTVTINKAGESVTRKP